MIPPHLYSQPEPSIEEMTTKARAVVSGEYPVVAFVNWMTGAWLDLEMLVEDGSVEDNLYHNLLHNAWTYPYVTETELRAMVLTSLDYPDAEGTPCPEALAAVEATP